MKSRPETKVCTWCDREKPNNSTFFAPRNLSRDGLDTCCRICSATKHRAYLKKINYYQNHREELIQTSTKWQKDNRERYLAYQKAYRTRKGEGFIAGKAE